MGAIREGMKDWGWVWARGDRLEKVLALYDSRLFWEESEGSDLLPLMLMLMLKMMRKGWMDQDLVEIWWEEGLGKQQESRWRRPKKKAERGWDVTGIQKGDQWGLVWVWVEAPLMASVCLRIRWPVLLLLLLLLQGQMG